MNTTRVFAIRFAAKTALNSSMLSSKSTQNESVAQPAGAGWASHSFWVGLGLPAGSLPSLLAQRRQTPSGQAEQCKDQTTKKWDFFVIGLCIVIYYYLSLGPMKFASRSCFFCVCSFFCIFARMKWREIIQIVIGVLQLILQNVKSFINPKYKNHGEN